jgi:hypothetical protein
MEAPGEIHAISGEDVQQIFKLDLRDMAFLLIYGILHSSRQVARLVVDDVSNSINNNSSTSWYLY